MEKLLQCSQDHWNLFLFSINLDICHLNHEKNECRKTKCLSHLKVHEKNITITD